MRRLACLLVPIAVLGLTLVACGSDDDEGGEAGNAGQTTSSPTATTPRPTATADREPPSCRRVSKPDPRAETRVPKPRERLDAGKSYAAEVSTSCGSFTIALDVKRAPRTTASFASLSRRGFYDGLTFHRIAQGFVIQGGDPAGDGSGGPGYSVSEQPPADLRYTRGTVAMAKTATDAPGTSGSQFFIVTAPDASAAPYSLPPEYAVVGRVTEGLDVIAAIAATESNPQTDQPAKPILIRRVRIRER